MFNLDTPAPNVIESPWPVLRRVARVPLPPATPMSANGREGYLVDVSPLGAQIRSPNSIRPSEHLTLAWHSNGCRIETSGIVKWSQASQAGARLLYTAGVEFEAPVSLRASGFVGDDFGLSDCGTEPGIDSPTTAGADAGTPSLELAPLADGLALAVNNSRVPVTPVPDERPQRSPRDRVRLSLRYRFPNEDRWYGGFTTDISDTGLAFDTDRSQWDFESAPTEDGGVPIEMILEVPSDATPAQPVEIGGRGTLSRTVRSVGSRQTHVAVAIERPLSLATTSTTSPA